MTSINEDKKCTLINLYFIYSENFDLLRKKTTWKEKKENPESLKQKKYVKLVKHIDF